MQFGSSIRLYGYVSMVSFYGNPAIILVNKRKMDIATASPLSLMVNNDFLSCLLPLSWRTLDWSRDLVWMTVACRVERRMRRRTSMAAMPCQVHMRPQAVTSALPWQFSAILGIRNVIMYSKIQIEQVISDLIWRQLLFSFLSLWTIIIRLPCSHSGHNRGIRDDCGFSS